MGQDARGFHTPARREVDEKVERVRALAVREGLAGILLSAQHNFAWLSGGGHNRVDGSRETGVAHLLVAADGQRRLIASNIEAERVASDMLDGLDFAVESYPWEAERADAALPVRLAARLAAGEIGADTGLTGARMVESQLTAIRVPLTKEEIARYRVLGADAARVMGESARQARRGRREDELAAELSAALITAGMRPIVVLAGADARIATRRHPVPTAAAWDRTLLLVACAERHGLIVALSRIVGAFPDADLDARTRACAQVFGRIASATVAGATGASIFAAAGDAYRAAGYPGEQRLHHQGGATGYRSREWVAHPASTDVVRAPQAFAWNPSISGTKVEETFLLHEDGHRELLTHDPEWPSIPVDVRGTAILVPAVLTLG